MTPLDEGGALEHAEAVVGPRLTHTARQPEWDCRVCDQPWPYPPARTELAELFGVDREGLRIYVGGRYAAALVERADLAGSGELTRRFVDWLPKVPRRSSSGPSAVR